MLVNLRSIELYSVCTIFWLHDKRCCFQAWPQCLVMPWYCGLGFPAVAYFYLSYCVPRLPSRANCSEEQLWSRFPPALFIRAISKNYKHVKFCGLVYWFSSSISGSISLGIQFELSSWPSHFLVADLLGQDSLELEVFLHQAIADWSLGFLVILCLLHESNFFASFWTSRYV